MRHVLVAVMVFALIWAQCPVFAQSVPVEPVPEVNTAAQDAATTAASEAAVHLNLSSTVASLSAPMTMTSPVNVNLGGVLTPINPGSAITPAQMIALQQVMQSGVQTLVLDSLGAAQSGMLSLSSVGQTLGSLSIPQGVTVLAHASELGPLNMSGNLVNSGSFYLYSTNPGVSAASVSALNIFNNQGAVLSTVLPSVLQASLPSALVGLSLNLSAINNIVNAGAITSSGNLSLYAGGSITNVGANSVMQAMQTLALTSMTGDITNAGLMAATYGNINVNAAQVANMTVNNLAGVMQALNGAINFRDPSYAGMANISLSGGDYLSQVLNFHGGQGAVDVNVNNVTGVVNAWANCARIAADSPYLQLGVIDASGDPYVTVTGNLDISSTTFSPYLVAIAGENIFTSQLNTSLVTDGGNLVLIAGATPVDASGTCASCITVDRSESGGDIYLKAGGSFVTAGPVNSQDIIALDTSNDSGNAGNLTLIAFADSETAQTVGGHVFLPVGVQINTYGSGNGINGNLTIIAEAASGASNTISIGDINSQSTDFGAGGGGRVTLSVATPVSGPTGPVVNTANGSITGSFDSALTTNLQNGALSVGSIVTGGAGNDFTHLAGSIILSTAGDITAVVLNAAGVSGNGGGSNGNGQNGGNGGNIKLLSGGVIATGSILSFGAGGGGGGGASTLSSLVGGAGGAGGVGGDIFISTSSTGANAIAIVGDVNSSGGGGGGGAAQGGFFRPTGPGGSGGAGGSAGSMELSAPSTILVTGNLYAAGGGQGGDGGPGQIAGSFDNAGGGGGGGGGSFGGSGGGGGGGVGYRATVGLPPQTGVGGGSGFGYSGGSWGGNGVWISGFADSGGGGGGGGGFDQTFTNAGIGPGGFGGSGGALFSVNAQNGFAAGAVGNSGLSETISLASRGVTVGGVINAVGSTVAFIPNSVVSIYLGTTGASAGVLYIDNSLIAQVTAQTISIGSLLYSGSIQVQGAVNSTPGLKLLTSPTGGIDKVSGTISVNTLVMQGGHIGGVSPISTSVTNLSATSTSGNTNVENNIDVYVSNSGAAAGGTFNLATTGISSIVIQTPISVAGSTGRITLSTDPLVGNGNITGQPGSELRAQNIDLYSRGNVGSVSDPLFISTGTSGNVLNLQLSALQASVADTVAGDNVSIVSMVVNSTASVVSMGSISVAPVGSGIAAGQGLSLTASAGGNGSIQIGNTVTTFGPVTLAADGTGTIGIISSITSNDNDIILIASNIVSSAPINAGAATVSLIPTSNQPIIVNGTTATPPGTFYVTGGGAGLLDRIAAGKVIVGAPFLAGSTTLANPLNLGGVGNYAFDVIFANNGPFFANGNAINTMGKSISITSGNNIQVDLVRAIDGSVILIAGRDVNFKNIDTSSSTGNGGNIVIIAGANFDYSGTIISVEGSSTLGGSILQTAGGTTLQSFSSYTGGAGGKIVMVANESSVGSDGTGTVFLQPATIVKSAGNGASSGDVVVIAGGNTGLGAAININGINTLGGNAGTGNITLVSASSTATTNDPVGVNSDTGVITGDFCCGPIQNGSVFVNSIIGNGESALTLKAGNTMQVSSITLDGGNGQNGGELIFVSGFASGVSAQTFSVGGATPNRIGSLSLAPGSGATTYGDIRVSNNGAISLVQVLRAELVDLKTTDPGGLATGPIFDAGGGTGLTPSVAANKVTLQTLGAGPVDNSIGVTITNNGDPMVDLIAKSSNGDVTIKVVGDASIVDSSGAGTDKEFDLRAATGTGGSIQINHDIIVGGLAGLIHLDADGAGTITRPNFLGTLFANTVNLMTGSGDLGTDASSIDMQTPNVTFSTTGSIYLMTVGSHILPVVNMTSTQTFSFRTNPDGSGNGSITLASNGINPTISAGTVRLVAYSGGVAGSISQQALSTVASISAKTIILETGGTPGNVTLTTTNKFDNTGVSLDYGSSGYTGSITSIGNIDIANVGGSGGSLTITAMPDINGNANISSSVFLHRPDSDLILITLGALSTISTHQLATSSGSGGGLVRLVTQGGDITTWDIFTDNLNTSNSQQTGGDVEISTGTTSINGGNISLGNIKASSYTFPLTNNVSFTTRGKGGNVTVSSVGATSSGYVHIGTIASEGDRGGGDVTVVSEFADVSVADVTTFDGARIPAFGLGSAGAGDVGISAGTTITVTGLIDASAAITFVPSAPGPFLGSKSTGGQVQLISFGVTAVTGAITVAGDIRTYGSSGAGSVIISSVSGNIQLGNVWANNIDLNIPNVVLPLIVGSVSISTGTLINSGGSIVVGSINTSSLQFVSNTGGTAGDVTLISTGNGPVSGSITVSGDINTMGRVANGDVTIVTRTGDIVHASGTISTALLTLASITGNIGSDPGASGRAITTQALNLEFGTSGNTYISQTGDLIIEDSLIGNSSVFELTGTGSIFLNGLISNLTQAHGGANQHVLLVAGLDILNTPGNSGNLSIISRNLTLQAPSGTVGANGDPLVVASLNINASSPNFISNIDPPLPAPTPSPSIVEEDVTITDLTLFSSTDLDSALNLEDRSASQQVQNSNVNIFQAGAQVAQDIQWASHNSASNNINTDTMMGSSITPGSTTQAPGPVDDQALGQNFAYCDAGNFNADAQGQMQSHGATIGQQSTANLCVLQQGNFLFQPHSDITVQVQEGSVEIPNGASALVMETGHDVAVFDISDGPKARVRVKSGNKIITMSPGKQVVLTRQLNADFDQINPSKLIGYKNPKGELVASDIRAYSADFSLPSVMMSVAPMKRMLTSDSPADRKMVQRMIKQAVVLSMLPSKAGPFKTSAHP